MKKIFKLSLLLAFVLLTSLNVAQAQRFGHLNSGNLIAALPEAQAANDKLVVYRDQLVADIEKQYKAFEVKVEALQKDYQAGNTPPFDLKKREAALEEERKGLLKQDSEITGKVTEKRVEYLEPIIKKLNDAISAVGKENGYTIIFDTSFQALLFVEESDNVMPLVRKKLGLKEEVEKE